ncbi:UDP-N-acetylmuramate--L-alanine ligase [Fastidiosibacter lacustris]|uniref:UDP-N-acetylmuramate--L-alanine ligase n=1 Tax=Fastidiosibacter lacustris TaxID=2056695 RepID=UPI000E34F4DD|nr:UDP-N-acetylmuramate--L-alanine ligase [Fastidiosibacter lacustris]
MNIINTSHIKPHYHFIGIGGIGMSALAIFCLQKGYSVSGSDVQSSEITEKLIQLGAKIHIEHHADHLIHADAVIYTSAMTKDNPEYQQAIAKGMKVYHRAEFLAFLIKNYSEIIAITGTHGKTTITSLIAHIMSEAELNPSYLIGGIAHNLKYHAYASNSPFVTIEADESDASFLKLNVKHLIISNVDLDHMQTYDHKIDELINSFAQFATRDTISGEILIGSDTENAKRLINKISFIKPQVRHYGFNPNMDIYALNYRQLNQQTIFDICYQGQLIQDFRLRLPGKHNVENALAAIALCLKLNISLGIIKKALTSFTGIYRRFDHYEHTLNHKQVDIIDDYGHHPVEINSTLEAIEKRFPNRRLVHVYQPHRYTRTRDLFDDFIDCLATADIVILMSTYAASEATIEGAGAHDLFNALCKKHKQCFYVESIEEAKVKLDQLITENDVILVQGAGDIAKLIEHLI